MITQTNPILELPFDSVRLKLTLRPEIQRLRDAALHAGQTEPLAVPGLQMIDAAAWEKHDPDEDWLLWRARRTAARLREMPIDLSPGERIVGRPERRPPSASGISDAKKAQEILSTMPPFPGGDAGHFHPDYEKLFGCGIRGIQEEIRDRKSQASTQDQRTFYQASDLAISGLSDYILRVADACEEMGRNEGEGNEAEWHRLVGICRRISHEPPGTFHEALQLMFFAIVALWFGEDHIMTSPGRMDQTLRPFYEKDLAEGTISRDEALELICLLFIQINMICSAGLAMSVMVGGRDGNGNDVTNELTYLCLAARKATQLVFPTIGLAWHEGTPSELVDFSCRMISTGIGDPAFFNDELIVSGLCDNGVTRQDAYNYMNSTCVEIKVAGKSNMWVTAPYFNCARGLLDVMGSIASGERAGPEDFQAFNSLVKEHMSALVGRTATRLDRVWSQREETGCFPLASCFIDDCLAKGTDIDRGGARYNWVENSFVGLANLVDGLIAIKRLVYDNREISIGDFTDILKRDYEGYEDLRLHILNRLPSYGCGDPEPDELACEWAEFLQEMTRSNVVGPHPYIPGFFCWVMHDRFGVETGATPDGRRAGTALADGAGAAQGREKRGPTASVLATTGWSHRQALGGLVHNVKFSKAAMRTDHDMAALRSLIEVYLSRGGFEIQVNVVDADTLRDAQVHPEKHADLLVRVAGYADYFVHLDPVMQADIIQRTEHAAI